LAMLEATPEAIDKTGDVFEDGPHLLAGPGNSTWVKHSAGHFPFRSLSIYRTPHGLYKDRIVPYNLS
jgi:hypothetical protein